MTDSSSEAGLGSSTIFGVVAGVAISLVCAILLISCAVVKRRKLLQQERERLERQIQILQRQRDMMALLQEAKGSHASFLSDTQIKLLSRRTISKNDDAQRRKTNDLEIQVQTQNQSMLACGVCLMDYSVGDLVVDLPCSHVFHDACVVPWLRTNDKCPLCIKSIKDLIIAA